MVQNHSQGLGRTLLDLDLLGVEGRSWNWLEMGLASHAVLLCMSGDLSLTISNFVHHRTEKI